MLDQHREVTSAITTNPTTAHWPQAEQNDVLLRFALCRGHHATKLAEVGHLIGVTKDRLREIQNKARMKLDGLLAEP